MVAGILDGDFRESGRSSALVVWVAIALDCGSSFIQKIEQRLRDVAGSLPAIFSHPDECVPVPGTEQNENHKPSQFELTSWRDKSIEIRKLFAIAVADSLDTIKRDAVHLSEAGNPCGLHVNQGSSVGGG
jgi:hypothetical protein